ncbi:hypothetical protein Tco_1453812, partial [Tanacetum coccineum]
MLRLNIVNDNIASAFMSTSKLNDSNARLGHVHFKRMQDMFKDGLIPDFTWTLKSRFNLRRISLIGFPARSVGSSNADALDLPYLLVLITGASQSSQHDKSESDKSRKSPTAELFDVDSGKISIHH